MSQHWNMKPLTLSSFITVRKYMANFCNFGTNLSIWTFHFNNSSIMKPKNFMPCTYSMIISLKKGYVQGISVFNMDSRYYLINWSYHNLIIVPEAVKICLDYFIGIGFLWPIDNNAYNTMLSFFKTVELITRL